MKSNIFKSLAKLTLSSLVISSVGCVQVSAMEQEQTAAVNQMMWELDNSILPFMARQTKLDFLKALIQALNEYILNIHTVPNNLNNPFYGFLESAMGQYNWTCPGNLTAVYGNLPFPSLSKSRREDVMKNIRNLCETISHTNGTELAIFYTMVQNEYDDFINNPLKLCKQHAENNKSYDLNSQ